MSKLKKLDYILTFICCIPLFIFGAVFFGGVILSGGVSDKVFILGYKPIITVSGSMEPTIATNAIGMSEKVAFDDIEVGDIIVFRSETDQIVIHRVVRRYGTGLITKGDANEYQDTWVVTEEQVFSRLINVYNWTAPYITFLVGDLTRADPLRIGVVIAGLVALIVTIILGIVWIYSYISINWYVNRGGEDVFWEMFWWFDERISQEELKLLFTLDLSSIPFFSRIIFKWRRVVLINTLDSERKQVRRVRKMYAKIEKNLQEVGRYERKSKGKNRSRVGERISRLK